MATTPMIRPGLAERWDPDLKRHVEGQIANEVEEKEENGSDHLGTPAKTCSKAMKRSSLSIVYQAFHAFFCMPFAVQRAAKDPPKGRKRYFRNLRSSFSLRFHLAWFPMSDRKLAPASLGAW